jgi:hypothetical protein
MSQSIETVETAWNIPLTHKCVLNHNDTQYYCLLEKIAHEQLLAQTSLTQSTTLLHTLPLAAFPLLLASIHTLRAHTTEWRTLPKTMLLLQLVVLLLLPLLPQLLLAVIVPNSTSSTSCSNQLSATCHNS